MTRHAADPLSLLFGAVFMTLGGFLLADRVDVAARLRWAGPVVLIVVAVVILGSALRSRRPDRDR